MLNLFQHLVPEQTLNQVQGDVVLADREYLLIVSTFSIGRQSPMI